MKLTPDLPRGVAFSRVLQSWHGSASPVCTDDRGVCSGCRADGILTLIPGARQWPHWMQHSLVDRLRELRVELFLAGGRVPSDSRTTLMDHFRGSGEWTEFIDDDTRRDPRAVLALEDRMRVFDLWL